MSISQYVFNNGYCFLLIRKNVIVIRDGPLEKWWGGGGGWGKKQQKKFMQGKCQEKKLMQKEGPIVTFSESLSFRNQQYYQAQYE